MHNKYINIKYILKAIFHHCINMNTLTEQSSLVEDIFFHKKCGVD